MEAHTAHLKSLGMRIERLRRARGWSQVDLASRSGVAVRTVSQAENGRSVKEGNLRKIVEVGLDQGSGALDRLLQEVINEGRTEAQPAVTPTGDGAAGTVANPEAVLAMSDEAWSEHIREAIRMIVDGTAEAIWGDERTREFKRGLLSAARLRNPSQAEWLAGILG